MDEAARQMLAVLLRDAIVPSVERHGAVVVDGGTDSGVMRMLGRERAARDGGFALIGVAAMGTVRVPGWSRHHAIADARAGRDADPRAVAIARSSLTRVIAVDDAAGLRATIDALLAGEGGSGEGGSGGALS